MCGLFSSKPKRRHRHRRRHRDPGLSIGGGAATFALVGLVIAAGIAFLGQNKIIKMPDLGFRKSKYVSDTDTSGYDAGVLNFLPGVGDSDKQVSIPSPTTPSAPSAPSVPNLGGGGSGGGHGGGHKTKKPKKDIICELDPFNPLCQLDQYKFPSKDPGKLQHSSENDPGLKPADNPEWTATFYAGDDDGDYAYDTGVLPFLPGVGNPPQPLPDQVDCDIDTTHPNCESKNEQPEYKWPKPIKKDKYNTELDRGLNDSVDFSELGRQLANKNTFYARQLMVSNE